MTIVSPKLSQESISTIADRVTEWFAKLPKSSNDLVSEIIRFGIGGESQPSKGFRSGKTKRKQEFELGRECAAKALEKFNNFDSVAVNEDRSPNWPDGFVGSISHNDQYAWATVAKRSKIRSVGIDVESLMSAKTHNEIHSEIVSDQEWELARNSNNTMSDEQLLTVLFSAKESFYKCWYPLKTCFFLDFRDVCLLELNQHSLLLETGELPSTSTEESKLLIYFNTIEDQTFTATWIEGGA